MMMMKSVSVPFAMSGVLLVASLLPAGVAAQQRIELPPRDHALRGQPETLWSVGREEGESWEMLSHVNALTFDAADNLYVLDAGNFRVLVFDRTGRYVRQIGKQGNGPGELTFPAGVGVLPDGDIVIADAGRGGYAIYGADGTYRKNIAGPGGMSALGASGFTVTPQGDVVMRTMPMLRPEAGAPITPPTASPIVRQALENGAATTTLFEIPIPAPKVTETGSSSKRRVMVMYAPPVFSPRATWGVLPDGGIAIQHEAGYAVRVIDRDGNVTRVFTRDEQPREVTGRDREDAREARRQQLAQGGGIQVRASRRGNAVSFGGGGTLSKDQIEAQLATLEFAETIPVVDGIRADPQGRIWVQRTAQRYGEDGAIDLLSGDGRYLGTLEPQPLPDAVSASGLAAYIEKDELDVDHVVVRRLPRDWR